MAASTKKPRLEFIDLPGEIRNIIYDLVLHDYGLKLDLNVRELVYSKQTPPTDLSLFSTTPIKNAILGTSRTIREEALPVLAKNATLEIRNHFKREEPLSILQPVLSNNIKKLEIDFQAFPYAKRSLLPALEQVFVVHRLEGIEGMEEALHNIYCPNCGLGGTFVIAECIDDVRDWRWMRKQMNHLAKEEGWAVYLKVLWEFNEAGDPYMDIRFDLGSEKLLSMEGYMFDVPIDVNKWPEAIGQIGDLKSDFPVYDEDEHWE